MSDCNKLAAWMIAHGLVTGHGDTTDDLLAELGPQIEKLRAEVADQKDAFNKLNEMLAESLEDRGRLRAEREQLAQMMIRQSLSTGHGDTVGDLVRELEPQIKRMRAEIVTLRNAAVNADERTDMLRGKLATAVLAHIDATAESDLLRAEVAALKKDAERNP